MPETPTPSVKGQVVGSPALHDSSSISSLAPATTMFGWAASIATAGSFCLFCENGVTGLPTLTRVSVGGDATAAPTPTDMTAAVARMLKRTNLMNAPVCPAAPESTSPSVVDPPTKRAWGCGGRYMAVRVVPAGLEPATSSL